VSSLYTLTLIYGNMSSKVVEKEKKTRARARIRVKKSNDVIAKILDVAFPVGDIQLDHSIEVRSVYHLYEMMKRGVIYIDPDLQRGYVWDDVKASLFIDSLYRGYPVHMILLARLGKDRYTVIDGVQRLVTIRRFFDNELRILKVSVIHPDIRGRSFSSLKHDIREKFVTSISMPVCFINLGNLDEKAISVITDMLRRVNISEQKMTTMQVIFCTFKTPSIQLIKRMSEYENYRKLLKFTESEIKAMYDKVLLMNLAISVHSGKVVYLQGYCFRSSMPYFSKFILENDEKKLRDVEQWIKDIIDTCIELGLERKHFTTSYYGLSRAMREVVSKWIFTAITVALFRLLREHDREEVIKRREELVRAIEDYFRNIDKTLYVHVLRASSIDHIAKIVDGLYMRLESVFKS